MTSEPPRISSKSRLERRKERTRRQIITVAVQLFRQHGFDETTMEQIAETADIAKGTLYNYFPAKEAILSAHIQQAFEDRHADRVQKLRQLPDTRTRLTVILGELMKRVQSQADIFEVYLAYRVRQVVSLRPDMSEGVKSAFSSLAVELIQLGQASGELRSDLPLPMLVDFFEFVFVEVAKPFYADPDTYDASTSIAEGVSLFMHGAETEP